MKIEIRKLAPDLLEDYLHFFETEAHADNPNEDRCYCVCWCSADHRSETDFSTPEKRRALAVQYVNNNTIQGYLAYCDGKVVGWCNANTRADCFRCISWLKFMDGVGTKFAEDIKIKSVYCFAIAPGMKRKGVATQLLERVCKDAAEDGFDFVEAYPSKKFTNEADAFMGPMEIYKRCGFSRYKTAGHMLVVRKPLR